MKPALIVRNLEHRYESGKLIRFPDLEVMSGKDLLILGKSGAGKSTLLHLLALILPVQAGRIVIDGQETANMTHQQLTRFRAEKIGLIHQQNHFIQSLNVMDNLLLANYFGGRAPSVSRAKKLAEKLEIVGILRKPVFELSGGEMQRVTIARALMNGPQLILADEPTSSLDDVNCEKVSDLLREVANEINASLIIVTHDNRLKKLTDNQIQLS